MIRRDPVPGSRKVLFTDWMDLLSSGATITRCLQWDTRQCCLSMLITPVIGAG